MPRKSEIPQPNSPNRPPNQSTGYLFRESLVVIHHAAYYIGIPRQAWHREDIFIAFCGLRLGVDFFFVLSGIVILMAHQKDLGSSSSLVPYAWKRFRRIYPVYWIVLGLWLPLYFQFSTNVDPQMKVPVNLLSNVLLVHLGGLFHELAVSWTLYHEILFYSVFALALVRRNPGLIVLGLWMAASPFVPLLSHSRFLTDYLFSPLHILFGLGMAVLYFSQKSRIPAPWAWLLGGTVGFFCCVLLAIRVGNDGLAITQCAGLASAVALLGAMHLERAKALVVPRALAFLGDASYSMYLVHMPAMMIAMKVLFPLWVAHRLSLPACFAAFVIIGIAAGIAFHLVAERPLLRWMGTLHSPPPQIKPMTAQLPAD